MNFRKIFSKKDPIVVAEIGNNHEGNFDRAIKLIDAAVDSGASAVKFQTYKLESYYNEKYTDKKRFKRHGFLRLAKELSVPLFAVFTKGECATFNMVRWPFLNTRVQLSWFFNIPVTLPFIFGWYGSWIPKRIHLKMKMTQVYTKTKEHYQYILNKLYD